MPNLPKTGSVNSTLSKKLAEDEKNDLFTTNIEDATNKKRKAFKNSRGVVSTDSGISLKQLEKDTRIPTFKNSSSDDVESNAEGNPNFGRRKSQWQSMDWKKVNANTFKYTLSQLARDGESGVLEQYLMSLPSEKYKRILNNNTDEDGITPLHMAARQNHYETYELLLKYGANSNCRTVLMATPMHFAARYQQLRRSTEEEDQQKSVIKLLYEYEAHTNAVDFEGLSALHYASVKGNLGSVMQLLECDDINIELKDTQGMTPLHVAATHGQLEVVKVLVSSGARLDSVDNDQMTVLHFACTEGIVEIVEVIMENLYNSNAAGKIAIKKALLATDAGKNTCLHVASSKGHDEIIREIIKWANKAVDVSQFVNLPRTHGDTPLHIAASQGYYEICATLLESGARVDERNYNLSTPLLLAAQQNYYDIIKLLFDNDADLEDSDKDNLTALLVACKHGHMDTVSWLINNGANVTASDKNDKNCLMLAVEENRKSTVEDLLEFDCIKKLTADTDINANSVLHLAAIRGYSDIMKLFREHNVRMDCKNEDEATPLHMAAQYGKNNVLKEILEHDKGSINAVDENANTALHLAAIAGHTKCVQTLLKLGANVGFRNTKQWSALDCACSGGYERSVTELINAGAQINPPSGMRTSPLHQACLSGHVQVVKLLLDCRADSGAVASDKRNALDCAIDNDNESCVEAILQHQTWKLAMRNAYVDPVTEQITTPLRKLIVKMPDLAELAFSNCISHNNVALDHPKFEVILDYEFLDDMYLVTEWLHKNKAEEEHIEHNEARDANLIQTSNIPPGVEVIGQQKINYSSSLKLQVPDDPVEYIAFTDNGKVTNNAMTYTSDANLLRRNHPLLVMVTAKRENLLQHPVVTSLLQYKWNKYGGFVYYLSLIFLLAFVGMLNVYMLSVPAPYTVDYLKSLANRRFYNEFTSQHLINYSEPSPYYSILDQGISYRGYKNTTASGVPCLRWDSTQTNSKVYPEDDLTENYCRNPGAVLDSPWCFTNYSDIDMDAQLRQECDVPRATVFAASSRIPIGSTCVFPFLYQGLNTTSCLARSSGDWCAISYNYDKDRKWGYCTVEDPYCDVPKELKKPCGSPNIERLNCEARGCCYTVIDEGLITEHSECYQKFGKCSNRDSYCEVYANRGDCEDDYDDMLSKCPLACGFCNETIEEPEKDSVRFLYVMSLYPKNTFEVGWVDRGYFCLPGAFPVWGSLERFKTNWEDVFRLVLLILCCLHLVRLLLQIWTYKWEAFKPIFFLELSLYILCILLVIDVNGFDITYTEEMIAEESLYTDLVHNFQRETGLRQNWQWQCGAMALFLSWMNLLLYIQKIPHLGIYVVMFNDVFKTFMKFSLVFLLFIVSFAFTFHTLLQNEVEFEFKFGSILKTTVMMVGELDFSGIFIGGEAYADRVNYSIVTYIIFVLFIVIMMIIIMNLLVGLAVGDIIAVQESATLSRLKMQVELALEVEFTVPNFLRKRLVEKSHVFHPNKYKKSNRLKRFLFENKHVTTKKVIGAVNAGKTETQEIKESIDDIQLELQNMKLRQNESDSMLREMVSMMKPIIEEKVTNHRKYLTTDRWSRSITPRSANSPSMEHLNVEPMNKEEANILLAPVQPPCKNRSNTYTEPPTIRLDFAETIQLLQGEEAKNTRRRRPVLPTFTADGKVNIGYVSNEDYFV